MAIILAEAKVGMANKVDQQIINTFRRSSLLLDRMTFDNAISPGTGGSTLTYGYIQLKTPTTAGLRTLNTEYTPTEAKREEKTAKAVIMGQSFSLDRVLQDTSGSLDEMAFQLEQAIKATSNYFHNLVINGTAAASGTGFVTNTFDGLKKSLNGASTNATSEVDISTSAKRTQTTTPFWILDLFADPQIPELRKLLYALKYFYIEGIPEDGARKMAEFISGGKQDDGEPQQLDLEFDAEEVYADFIREYQIDLFETDMHWYKFLALLNGLSDNGALARKINIRTMDISNLKGKEKYNAQKAKDRVQIPVRYTKEELAEIAEFEKWGE